MDIIVFSNARKIRDCFKIYRKSSNFSVPLFLPVEEINKSIKQVRSGALIYIDLYGLDEKEIPRYLRHLSKKEDIFYGVLDFDGKIKDVTELFHNGAVDYVSRLSLGAGITPKRLSRVLQYLQASRYETLKSIEEKPRDTIQKDYRPSGNDWKEIKSGKEYTFYLMFIELDDSEEMEKKYGRKNLTVALSSFKKYVEESVNSFNGRVWIWSRFGGLILFPFNEDEFAPLECGFRLILFKPLYDIEESLFPHFLSFRMAIHIGNIIYSKINTGNIISDSLNTIFHLGQQFAEPGNFYVTEDVLQFAHSAFMDFFLDSGFYEDRKILRMRLPLHTQ